MITWKKTPYIFNKIIQTVKEGIYVTCFHYYKLFTQQYFFQTIQKTNTEALKTYFSCF